MILLFLLRLVSFGYLGGSAATAQERKAGTAMKRKHESLFGIGEQQAVWAFIPPPTGLLLKRVKWSQGNIYLPHYPEARGSFG